MTQYIRCLAVADLKRRIVRDYAPLADARQVAALVDRASDQAELEVLFYWVASVPAHVRNGRVRPHHTRSAVLYRGWQFVGIAKHPLPCPYEARGDCPDRCPPGVESCIPF